MRAARAASSVTMRARSRTGSVAWGCARMRCAWPRIVVSGLLSRAPLPRRAHPRRTASRSGPAVPGCACALPAGALSLCRAGRCRARGRSGRLYTEKERQLEERKRIQAQLVRSEKLSAVGELASGVAHEINNPLTTILGQAHLILAHPQATEPVRERARIVTDEAARAARIVQNLLLFARQYPSERRPCSLAAQARRVLELKSYQLQQDNVKVVTEFAPSPYVLGDENALQQVLLNLVQNAHQAMVQIAGARVLMVRVWPDDASVCLEVRDTGPGIPEEAMPRIFDPFFTTKPPGEGSGLGLSVSYGIVTGLGGRLWAENHPDGGASFRLELPAGDEAS